MCDFFLDLRKAQPPQRRLRFSPWSATTRKLEAGAACKAVRALQTQVHSETLPSHIDLGPAADADLVARMLPLLTHWTSKTLPRAAAHLA